MFILRTPEPSQITNLQNNMGWDGYVGLLTGDPGLVHWQTTEMGSRILPGQSGLFSFTTPVCAIADSTGEMYDEGFAYGGGGQVKGPDVMIRSVTWDTYNQAGLLSTNRNLSGGMMPGGGKRIFADRLKPTDLAADSGDQVYVRVELSHVVETARLVEGYLFDVDDPSSADAILDDETKDADDNRGVAPSLGRLAITIPAGRNSVREKIRVSTKPGDNFRFAATVDPAVELGTTVKPKEQGQGAATTYGDGVNAGIYHEAGRGAAVANRDAKTVKSEMLTVWRRLHVERDHMKAPAANYEYPADDSPVDGAALPDPSISLLSVNIAAGYVQVFDDLGSSNTRKLVIWNNNLPSPNVAQMKAAGDATRDVASVLDFWVVHIIGAYEGEEAKDFDFPAGALPKESAVLGTGVPLKQNQNYLSGSTFIFIETIRDVSATWTTEYPSEPAVPTLQDFVPRIVLHEVLHRFDMIHKPGLLAIPPNPGDEGCMNTDNNWNAAKLNEHKLTVGQLAAVRSAERP